MLSEYTPFKISISETNPGETSMGKIGKPENRKGKKIKKRDRVKSNIKKTPNPILILPESELKPKIIKIKLPVKMTIQAWLRSIKITKISKIKRRIQKSGFFVLKAKNRESKDKTAKNIAACEILPSVLKEEDLEKSKGRIKIP